MEEPATTPAAPPAPRQWTPRRRGPGVALIGAVLGFGVVLCVVFLWLGGRAATPQTRYPMHNVIGLPLAQAKRLLQQPGPVSIKVVKVPYGANGIVLRATGFDIDGTYASSSRITLQVGGHVPRVRPSGN